MIDQTPHSERPRERCLSTGPESLSLRECLALILGSGPSAIGCMGVALHILKKSEASEPGGSLLTAGPPSDLSEAEQEIALFTSLEREGKSFLQGIFGLGATGQARILASFEIGRRYSQYRSISQTQGLKSRPRTSDSRQALDALKRVSITYRTAPYEWLGFIPVHRCGRLAGQLGTLIIVERGARTHVNIDPAEFFARLLALRPSGFYLFHNHPSGMTLPSAEDYELTRLMAEMSQKLGITLKGHWIVGPENEECVNLTFS
jgi:DNA repair protein RadC